MSSGGAFNIQESPPSGSVLGFSDSLNVATRPNHLALGDMARNYRSASRTSGASRNDSSEVAPDPLGSLRNRQRREEDFSLNDCLKSGCQHLYDFTIASCQYTFCDCLKKRRRESYTNLDEVDNPEDEEVSKMKAELRFHFMNPFEKWKHPGRRRFPWKLIMQLLVILLVTSQLWIKASQRRELRNFVSSNKKTFNHLFFENPTEPSPNDYYGESSVSTIRTLSEFWKQLNYTVTSYYLIRENAVGPYGYSWQDNTSHIPSIHFSIEHYVDAEISPEEKMFSYIGDKTIDHIKLDNLTDVQDQLADSVITHNFTRFSLSSVFLSPGSKPLCCQFDIEITIENSIFKGSLPINLNAVPEIDVCNDKSSSYSGSDLYKNNTSTIILDCFVLLATVLSTVQCIRSLTSSARFTKKVRAFFLKQFNYRLRLTEYLPLYSLWFVGVIVSNLLVDIGTILYLITNLYLEKYKLELSDVSSIIFGLGVFFQWLGILRFLSYFDKYNMLLITLRLAMPSVVRFMICGGIFYIAFLLLGWLVLGPYHPKFRDPSVTSECLYSLINGDDMFDTYIFMEDVSFPAFVFSKIYLYVFISLFIYVVLSVFISLISDTYETLHELWTIRSRGLLQDFANDGIGQTQGTNDDNDFEFLASTRGSPLVANGLPIINRHHTQAATPTLHHLHPTSANTSPQIPIRGINTANLDGSNIFNRSRPGVIVTASGDT